MNEPLPIHHQFQADDFPVDPQVWLSIWIHLIWAAILWVVFICLVGFCVDGVPSVNAFLFGMFFGLPMVGLASATLGGFTILIAALVAGTIGLRIPSALVGAFVGGWIGGGYMTLLLGSAVDLDNVAEFATPFAFLITSATIMGSYAGAIGAWRGELQTTYDPFAGTSPRAPASRNHERSFHFRFGLRHMMIASAWLCGFLGVARMAGLLTPDFMVPMGMWFALQLVILAVGSLFWRPYTRWRVRMWERWNKT
jgi:hypothetical protein